MAPARTGIPRVRSSGCLAVPTVSTRRLPTPYVSLRAGRAVLRFYHDDALRLLDRIGPD